MEVRMMEMNTTENAMNRINVAKVTVDNIAQAYGGQAFAMDDPIMQGDAPLHEYRAFGIDFPDDDQANITIEFRPNDSEPLHIQAVREGSITGEWDSRLDNAPWEDVMGSIDRGDKYDEDQRLHPCTVTGDTTDVTVYAYESTDNIADSRRDVEDFVWAYIKSAFPMMDDAEYRGKVDNAVTAISGCIDYEHGVWRGTDLPADLGSLTDESIDIWFED